MLYAFTSNFSLPSSPGLSQLHSLQQKVKEKQVEATSLLREEVNEASSDDEWLSLPSSVSRTYTLSPNCSFGNP